MNRGTYAGAAPPTMADVRRALGRSAGGDRYVIVILGHPIESDPYPLRFGAWSDDLLFLKNIVDQSPHQHHVGTWLIWDRRAGQPIYMRCSAAPSNPCPPSVSGIFDDLGAALKGAVQSVVSFVKKPPAWFATIFPLMTMENQRYWAGKLGGSTGEKIYDAGVKAVALKYLGPQGPALVETYNKVTEDAARGNLNAKEILAKAPEIAKLAAASNQGPDAFRAAVAETKSAVKVSGDEGEQDMTYAGYNYVGAEGQSYPEVASRAVRSVHAQRQSPYYGYLRSGINQKIYLFNALDDARGWFDQHVQLQPDHDYAAVFSAANLSAPMRGMEHYMRTPHVGCDPQVGNWWPFLLGLPLGGLGGYFLRRWQEQNPGRALPLVPPGKLPAPQIPPTAVPPTTSQPAQTSGAFVGGPWMDVVGQQYGYGGYSDGYDYSVGGPWVDLTGPQVGGPWLDFADPMVSGEWYDVVGAQADEARRREWPQTRALIQSAIDEVKNYAAHFPRAEAFVWKLDAPGGSYAGRAPESVVMLDAPTAVFAFSSQRDALDYLRELAQTRPVALAMFERNSRHWPNPVAWRKSDQPEHARVIAQHVASKQSTQTSGTYAGADTMVGAAIDDVRKRARDLANRRAGSVVGVIHTSKDGLWHSLAFRSADDADDWIETATQNPATYTYAAYFDKEGDSWPAPYIEKVSGMRAPPGTQLPRRSTVGAAIDEYRAVGKAHASGKPGQAAGAILTADRRWKIYGFTVLDDAISWLQKATQDKGSFIYAAAYEKGSDGTAYIQDEEFGGRRAPSQPGEPIPRDVATTSGEWWAA